MSWLRGAAIALVLSSAASVNAAPPTAESNRAADLRTARELYDKGITAYNLGEYDTAVAQLKRSYELSKAPQLLFNIAQAYRAKGDHRQALMFYRTYLRLIPNARNRADAETLALEMERKSADDERLRQERDEREAAQKREASQRAAEVTAQQRAAELSLQQQEAARRVAEESRPVVGTSADSTRLTATASPPRKPVYKKWWFWTAVGGAAVVAATVTVVAVTLSSRTVTPSGNLGTIDGRP